MMEESEDVSNFSRRSFLKMAAATSAVGLLAACVAPMPGQPGGVPTAPGNTVRILLPSWATAEMPFDTAAREFNEANPGTNVQIQTAGEGWDTKVMSQIASDTLEVERRGHCLVGIVELAALDFDRDDSTR